MQAFIIDMDTFEIGSIVLHYRGFDITVEQTRDGKWRAAADMNNVYLGNTPGAVLADMRRYIDGCLSL